MSCHVVAVQPVFGSNPDEAVPALDDVENHTLREAICCGEQLIVGGGLGVQLKCAHQKQKDKYFFQTFKAPKWVQFYCFLGKQHYRQFQKRCALFLIAFIHLSIDRFDNF